MRRPVYRDRPLPTEDAARADLWHRFRAALPADLRLAGAAQSDEAQNARWGFEPSTSLLRRLFLGTKARDQRGWHTTTSELDRQDGTGEFRHVAGETRIGLGQLRALIGEIRGAAGS